MQKGRQRPDQPWEQNSAPGLRWPPQKPYTTTSPVSPYPGPGAALSHLGGAPSGPHQPLSAPEPLSPGVLSPQPASEGARPRPHPQVALPGVHLGLRAA